MATGSREVRRLVSAWALSVAAHAALVGVGAALVARTLSERQATIARASAAPPAADAPIEIDLPTLSDGSLSGALADPPLPAPLARGGGDGTPRPDTGTRGRGGADQAERPAVNLADRDDGALLSPEVRSRLDRSQIQRVASSDHRASREDWRASREPMELTFLAQGHARSARPERRRPADVDPSAGAADRGAPARAGGPLGAAPLPADRGPGAEPGSPAGPPSSTPKAPRAPGGPLEGAVATSAGRGVRDGLPGPPPTDAAAVALARPKVAEGTPAVPATLAGRPSDTLDSEQEVATAIQSLIHASAAGGARGAGPGGQDGPGPSGAGGVQGPGSRSRALGTGRGGLLDNDPLDRRRSLYIRQVMAKVHPLWANAFPKWAAAEGLQGTVIVTFVIRADGSLASAAITRPSGLAEFDENCRGAVLRAAPYPPMPDELGATLRLAMPFEARNPAVLPKRPRPDP